jgi:hypothetical protein
MYFYFFSVLCLFFINFESCTKYLESNYFDYLYLESKLVLFPPFATQQPAGAMRQQEVSAVIGQQEEKEVARREDEGAALRELTQQPAGARQQESSRARGQQESGMTRGDTTTSR